MSRVEYTMINLDELRQLIRENCRSNVQWEVGGVWRQEPDILLEVIDRLQRAEVARDRLRQLVLERDRLPSLCPCCADGGLSNGLELHEGKLSCSFCGWEYGDDE
jgi:hypothetical protein